MVPTQSSLFEFGEGFPSVESQRQGDNELYKADFDEQIIKKRSEHASDAVRLYKRPSIELEQRVSRKRNPPTTSA